jgi:hypothetical protein
MSSQIIPDPEDFEAIELFLRPHRAERTNFCYLCGITTPFGRTRFGRG